MEINKMVSEVIREVGSLEMVQLTSGTDLKIKSINKLRGIYMSDGTIEILAEDGTCVEVEQNKYLKFEKIGLNSYKISNRSTNLLIRPID